jgi:hypothetical protein
MGKQNEMRLRALPSAIWAALVATRIADANATLKTQAGAWRSRSLQQQQIIQATAKHEDDWYANEQDRRHVKASRFNGNGNEQEGGRVP